MSFTNYLENELLDHVFSAAAWTAPATLYLGLSTTAINDDGTGLTEPTGNAYARVAVTNNATNWPAASNGLKSNGVKLTFPTATGSWGTISYFFLSDAASGGNLVLWGQLSTAKAIDAGDQAFFNAGDIDITLD